MGAPRSTFAALASGGALAQERIVIKELYPQIMRTRQQNITFWHKMANNKRTFKSIVTGIWIRLLTIIIPFTFPAHLTTFLHRLRGVKIGKGSKINRTVQIDDSFPYLIEIGKNVWVTAGVMLICHQRDLTYYEIGKPVMDCPLKTAPIIIKDGAHIGIGTIVLPGVTIGEGSVIGAGSIVISDIPPHCVAVGSPAKAIKFFGK